MVFSQQQQQKKLPRIKDGAYIINPDNKQIKGTHWVSLFIKRITTVCFDSFGIECIPQKILIKIKNKSVNHSIFRIQSGDCIMCGFYCIAFIEYIIARKTLLVYINLFDSNDYQENDRIVYKCFKNKCNKVKRKP